MLAPSTRAKFDAGNCDLGNSASWKVREKRMDKRKLRTGFLIKLGGRQDMESESLFQDEKQLSFIYEK